MMSAESLLLHAQRRTLIECPVKGQQEALLHYFPLGVERIIAWLAVEVDQAVIERILYRDSFQLWGNHYQNMSKTWADIAHLSPKLRPHTCKLLPDQEHSIHITTCLQRQLQCCRPNCMRTWSPNNLLWDWCYGDETLSFMSAFTRVACYCGNPITIQTRVPEGTRHRLAMGIYIGTN